MATMKLYIGDGEFWYSDEEYGPPLPHSLWLWEHWGCYEHYNCVCFVDPLTPRGQMDRLIHQSLEELREELENGRNGYKHAESCECWAEWLLGKMTDKDYPQTYEPLIRQTKRGKK